MRKAAATESNIRKGYYKTIKKICNLSEKRKQS